MKPQKFDKYKGKLQLTNIKKHKCAFGCVFPSKRLNKKNGVKNTIKEIINYK